MNRPNVRISAGAYLAAAYGVLALPLNWLVSFFAAAALHELAHLLVLKFFRIPVYEITIGGLGAKISTGPMLPRQELLCAAAGPLCSLSLVLLAKQLPVLSLIGLIQGVFNLLPVFPLDGGRILAAVRCTIAEKRAE